MQPGWGRVQRTDGAAGVVRRPMPVRCPVCGTPPVFRARYCFACGASLYVSVEAAEATVERRIVTVLFGDLSDFTAWAEDLDPERVGSVTDRVLAALATAVEDLGGHVDKLTGDGIMAVFGAPIAHEDDPERAIRAAARMQQDVRRLLEDEVGGGRRLGLRVGLNTGEVLAGVQAAMAYTVVGDTVNTASRLADAARIGAIFAGRRTAEATREAASWRALSPLRLRGKRTPVSAFELVALRPPTAVRLGLGDEARFLGRDGELASLVARLLECAERGEPASVLVTGDAGIGKTRLITELIRVAEERPDTHVLRGRCTPYGEGRDLAPVLDWVRTAAGIGEGSEPAVAWTRLRRTVARLWLPDRLPVSAVTEALAALLGLSEPQAPQPRDTVTPGGTAGLDDPLLDGVAALMDGLARSGPLLLVLDDLQWGSPELQATVGAVMSRLSGPVLLLGALRSAQRDPRSGVIADWWRRLPAPDVLILEPLAEGSSEQLLGAYLGGATLAEDARQLLLSRAQGNPFFLEALLHWLVDRRLLVRTEGAWQLEGPLPADVLPAGVQSVLAARIDDLDPDVRAVLGEAAVIGTTFSRSALAAMHGSDGPPLASALNALIERGLVVAPTDLSGGAGYAFTHRLTRDVAYERMSKGERARRHAAVAAWARTEMPGTPGEVDAVVAGHAERALALAAEMGLPEDDLAWQARLVGAAALGRLGDFALARDDDRAADGFFSRAADAGGQALSPRDGLRLVVSRCAVRVRRHHSSGVEETLQPALVATDPAIRAAALVVLGDLRRRRGEVDAARQAFVSALADAGDSGTDQVMAEALRHLGLLNYSAGRLLEADACFRDGLQLAERVGDRRGAGWALQHLAWTATTRGRYSAAAAALAQAGEVFAALEDSGGLSWCAGTEAFVRLLAGRLAEARELASGLVPVAEAVGERWGVAACLTISAHAAAELGDTDDALQDAIVARDRFAELHDTWGQTMAIIALGVAVRCSGHPRRAVRILREAVALSSAGAHPVTGALAHAILGYCYLDKGDPISAERVARDALTYLEGLELEPQAVVGVQVLLAQALRGQGRLDDALALLATAVDADVEPTLLFPRRQALAHHAGALLDAGRVQEAVVEIERALAVPAEDVRSRVVTLRVLAAVRARIGDPGGAREALNEALEIAKVAQQRTEVETTKAALIALSGLSGMSGMGGMRRTR